MNRHVTPRGKRVEAQDRITRSVLQMLAQLRHETATDIDYPDKRDRNQEAVDLIARLGSEQVALEHTSIEQFPDSFKVDRFLKDVGRDKLARLKASLEAQLPPGSYELSIRKLPGQLSSKKFDLFFDRVSAAVRDVFAMGDRLHGTFPESCWRSKACDGLNGDIHVRRTATSEPARVNVAVFGPKEHESRVAVIERAFAGKRSRLQAYKGIGYTTVLVMEDVAFSLVMPSAILVAGRLINDPRYANSIDYAVVVIAKPDMWEMQYTEARVPFTRDRMCSNLYFMDPGTELIVKSDDEGSPAPLQEAMAPSGLDRSRVESDRSL